MSFEARSGGMNIDRWRERPERNWRRRWIGFVLEPTEDRC